MRITDLKQGQRFRFKNETPQVKGLTLDTICVRMDVSESIATFSILGDGWILTSAPHREVILVRKRHRRHT